MWPNTTRLPESRLQILQYLRHSGIEMPAFGFAFDSERIVVQIKCQLLGQQLPAFFTSWYKDEELKLSRHTNNFWTINLHHTINGRLTSPHGHPLPQNPITMCHGLIDENDSSRDMPRWITLSSMNSSHEWIPHPAHGSHALAAHRFTASIRDWYFTWRVVMPLVIWFPL